MPSPNKDTPLQKRIRRHIVGRQREFFIATRPGMEAMGMAELKSLLPQIETASVVSGGVTFSGRMVDCYRANLQLRTVGRVLMRIADFKATNFRQLARETTGIPWELYLHKQANPEIRVSARGSRLYHKKAIIQHMAPTIRERLLRFGMDPDEPPDSTMNQMIFVRVRDDRFGLSIDSSGPALYKRGMKTGRAIAPIRESIASAILRLSGYTGTGPLIDPMCGSGTFSLEGAMVAKQIPPGWFRDFAFMDWPAFRPRQWAFLKKEAGKAISRATRPRIFASDADEKACGRLRRVVDDHRLADIIHVSTQDFFELSPQELTDQVGWVVINPPYGRRIGNRRDSDKLFRDICSRLRQAYLGWKLALIGPRRDLEDAIPSSLTTHSLHHGGLRLLLFEGTIQ